MTRLAALLCVSLAGAPAAAADGELPSPANFDGIWISIGPAAAVVRMRGEWLSAVGLEASVVRVRRDCLPAAVGLAFGGLSYAERAGGRFWLEAEAAVADPVPLGLSLGGALEVSGAGPTRPGGQVTFWMFAGLVPYLRVGGLANEGRFVEVGLMLKIPAHRFP